MHLRNLWLAAGTVGAIVCCADAFADVCGAPATPIHVIQGASASSPLAGRSGVEIEGVVVGDFRGYPERLGGFFVQEEDADADASALTSEGIFVFAADVDLERGDTVRVRGSVREFFGLTELGAVESVQRCWPRGGARAAALHLPVAEPGDWERVEGMLVRIEQPLVASDAHDLGAFGELVLAAGERLWAPTQRAAPGVAARAWHERNLRHRVLLDDGRQTQNPTPTPYLVTETGDRLRLGDRIASLEGVVDYGFGSFRIQPTTPVRFASASQQRAPARARDGALRVAAWNLENFFNGDGSGSGFPTRGAASAAEQERQRARLVTVLAALDADVYALVELENDGVGPRSAAGELARALADRTGAPIEIVDAGALGSQEIAVGLFYRRDRVQALGAPAVLDERADPSFDTARNRPSLAQSFAHTATGERVTIAVNHWKSKGSPCDSAGDPDVGDGQGNCNRTRARAAIALAAWLARDPTRSGGAPALVVGDLNSYPKEDPIAALSAAGLVDLLESFAGRDDAYSYVFGGAAGRLDHAFASASLVPFAANAEIWHANADEPPLVDPARASDHDPVIVDLFPDADRDGVTDTRDLARDCALGDPLSALRIRSGLRGTANAPARRELLRRCASGAH